jgi:cell division protein FtsZ
VGIVTMPFQFEGKTRNDQAETGLNKLRRHVDSLIVINNNKLREVYGDLGFKQGFAKADEVLANASRGIAEVITHHYTQNIDLKDAKTVLSNSGTAIMGSATASGTNRGQEAVSKALDSPLLNDNKIIGAKNVLLLIVSGSDEVTIDEIGLINEHIQREAGNSANIIMGIGEDETLREAISVTVIATGFNAEQQDEIVHVDPKKIIHSLEEEQAVVHTLESQQIDMFTPDAPQAVQQNEHVLIPTNEVLRNIEVVYESVVAENKPSLKLEDFIIHELPPEVNDIDVVDPVEVTPQPVFEAPIADIKEENEEVAPVLFHLEEEPVVSTSLTNEPVMKQDVASSLSTQKSEAKRYNLEDFMEPTPELVSEIEVKEPEVVEPDDELTPLNSTITEGLAKRSEERRQKLKEFNYKFYNNRVEDYEKEPAYKRAMVDLEDSDKTTSVSRMSVNTDANEEMRLRTNNSFLHDNVD